MDVVPLLSAGAAAEFLERVRALEFIDGRSTARGAAKGVKSNRQARKTGDAYLQIHQEITALLAEDPRVHDAAFPRLISRPLVNRYGIGDAYGLHVDRSLSGGVHRPMRRDLSYTLFLTPLEDYVGGELQIATAQGMKAYRLEPGAMVIYPTGYLHQVTPVTSGERVCIVGWIESWIADPHYREVMSKLKAVQGSVESGSVSAMVRMQLGEVVENLIRYGASR